MHDIALDLLFLLAGIWLVAVTLRPLGLPTIMGELIVGVLSGGSFEPIDIAVTLAKVVAFFGPVSLGWLHIDKRAILDHDGSSSRNPRR
jgi:Kef-type K+ transport system membrane component KefB